MKSPFHQITVHRDTIPLTAFVTSSGISEWKKMPQGSSATPGWFCKVVNEVITNLRGVASYLDDLLVFDETPAAHVATIRSLFERLSLHNLKLTPPKAPLFAPRKRNFSGTPSLQTVSGLMVTKLLRSPKCLCPKTPSSFALSWEV
ncbi:unnamed protein product [Ectocarpus sp. CCAP 1310/34]|nr:unnamed protein product [Ectocarpus sp. CCAP 1310/34]